MHERLEAMAARALGRIPRSVLRRLVGPPVTVDGQVLNVEAQVALRLLKLANRPAVESLPVHEARAETQRAARVFAGRRSRVAWVEALELPGPAGSIPARLYVPREPAGPGPLLVYFHGGGWTVGDLDTHDGTCRFLAREADALVLSVDYRLGPEAPFPAAVEDALAAFQFATEHFASLGADPGRIAIGGDSAGANLATVVAQLTTTSGGPAPGFQLLFYPVTDVSIKRPSFKLFGEGFYPTERQTDWYRDHYLPDRAARLDLRVSPLLAEDLAALPPTYIATAGFDPLRDEGHEYAGRLRDAGVAVTHRFHRGLPHGFVNAVGVGRAGREATREAAHALREWMLSSRDRQAEAPEVPAADGAVPARN